MKSILMSVKPREAMNILNGEQTIIIKKSAPKETPFKAYIYCTKGKSNSRLYKEANSDGYFLDREGWRGGDYEKRYLSGKVVAEFVCSGVEKIYFETTVYVLNVDNEFKNISFGGKSMTEPYYNGKVATIKNSCLTQQELVNYGKGKTLYALHITDLKIYDEPRELGEFRYLKKERYGSESVGYIVDKYIAQVTRPPQSWQYVEGEE